MTYSGTVAAEIRGDAAFEAFCLGCRVIDVAGLSLSNVPKRWRLPESEWADVEETAAGGAADIPADPAAVAAMCDGACVAFGYRQTRCVCCTRSSRNIFADCAIVLILCCDITACNALLLPLMQMRRKTRFAMCLPSPYPALRRCTWARGGFD